MKESDSAISRGWHQGLLFEFTAVFLATIFTVIVFFASSSLSNEFLLGLIALDGLLITAVIGLIQFAAPSLDQLDLKAKENSDTVEQIEKQVRKYLPRRSKQLAGLIHHSSFALAFSILLPLFIAAVLAFAVLSHMVPQPSFWRATLSWVLAIISFWLTSWSFLRCLLHLSSIVASGNEKT